MDARVMVNFDLEDLAEEIGWHADPEHVLAFVLHLDAIMADQGFTKELIQKLQESLEEEL